VGLADNPIDLCRERLGEPDAIYRVSPGRFRAKLAGGLVLVVGGAAGAAALFWFAPKVGAVAAKVVFAPLGFGVLLLWHLSRSRGLAVLAYPTGLVKAQRGTVESYPWDQVTAVTLKADKGTVVLFKGPDGAVTDCRIAVEPPSVRLGSAAVTVTRADGATATFTAALEGYSELVDQIQQATYPRLWDAAWADLLAGRPVAFGPLEVSLTGLKAGKNLLAWVEFGEVTVASKRLTVKRPGKWAGWTTQSLEGITNPHVLIGLMHELHRLAPAAAAAAKQEVDNRDDGRSSEPEYLSG
jgi:hypothetical protein